MDGGGALEPEMAGRQSFASTARRGIDPRLIQMSVLASLLVVGVALFDLPASLPQAAVTVLAALGAQWVGDRLRRAPCNWRSAIITGLSLTLLLRSHDPLVWAAAPAIGIAGKFLLRVRDKHVFNPACLGLVSMLLLTDAAWVSPGQWGALAWSAAALVCAGGLVLSRAGRVDIAAAFLLAYAGLLAWRCFFLGDPWSIPAHQMQSGALLIFSFFMITDPRATPDSRIARVAFALAVAALAYQFQFRWQVREGFFYALALVSLTTPLLDTLFRTRRFTWASPRPMEA